MPTAPPCAGKPGIGSATALAMEAFAFGGGCRGVPYLKDEMTLKSRGPIPIYYESLYGI